MQKVLNPFTKELVDICEIKLSKGKLNRSEYLKTRVKCLNCKKNKALSSFYEVSIDTMHNKCKVCRNREIKKTEISEIYKLLSTNLKINELIEKL